MSVCLRTMCVQEPTEESRIPRNWNDRQLGAYM